MKKKYLKDVVFSTLFVIFGVLSRTVFHIAPNVEFVTALSIAAGYFLSSSISWIVPLGIMVISDLMIGNSAIYIFTWSAFLIGWGFGMFLRSNVATRIFSKIEKKIGNTVMITLKSESAGVLFTIFFFLWTNFGVVLVSTLYPKTLEGVAMSYVAGLPFLRPQLVGNILFVPLLFVITNVLYNGKVLEVLKSKILRYEW